MVWPSTDGAYVDLHGGDFPLPFGSLSISFDTDALRWAGFRLTNFVPAAELHIEGLQNRYRDSGIGAPLTAALIPAEETRGFQVARALKLPTTALLRLDITPAALANGQFHGKLSLYSGEERRVVDIGGQQVPLENEPSAAFAFALSNPAIWRTELAGFFQGDLFDTLPSQLIALEPYRPGRIPVVLIHGTASSAGRWADLINDLQNDPAISERFQFWLFTYNTGNPIPLSALQLRTDLTAAVNKLDPGSARPGVAQHGADWAQPGRAAGEDAGHQFWLTLLRCIQFQADRRTEPDGRNAGRRSGKRCSSRRCLT